MKKLLFLFGILFFAFALKALPPSWNYTVTYNSHVILLSDSAEILLDGIPIDVGDYLGVFYVNGFNQLACGGYTQWTGALTSLSAWPEDQGNDGFQAGDEFIWMIWDASSNTEHIGQVSYSSGANFPNQGIFTPNGISGLSTFSAQSYLVPWTYSNTGLNHVVLLPQNFNSSINGASIEIGDYIGAFYTDNGIPHCGGYSMWLGQTNSITLWGDDNQTSVKDGFGMGEDFVWKIWDASTDQSYFATPYYMTTGMPNTGQFTANGLSGLDSLIAITSNPGWSYSITGINHTILIPFNSNLNINGIPIEVGDYIGVFYDSSGFQACAGYTEWNGATTYISAWGDDSQTILKEGFYSNEEFQWKIWDKSADSTVNASATYDSAFPNQGNFAVNGQSKVDTLHGIILSFPWNYSITCCNHTLLIPANAQLTFDNSPMPTGVFIGVFYDSLGVQACGGYAYWDGSSTTIAAWGDDSQTLAIEGFADQEIFHWKIWDPLSGDEFDAQVNYIQPPAMPNTNQYVTNGMSGIESLTVSFPSLPWSFTNTGNNHTILIPDSMIVDLYENQLEYGDYFGVFFDSLGTLKCAGYVKWEGTTTALTAWGEDLGLDGFAQGEMMNWKLWDYSTDSVFPLNVSYLPGFPNQENYATNGISAVGSISSAPPYEIQSIELNSGWGMYSTYIVPFNPLLDSVFADIVINVDLVKNGDGEVYWPDYNVNFIGNLVNEDGYQIKMKNADTLNIPGTAIQPELYPFTIDVGWGIIAYLRQSPIDIEVALNPIVLNIELVKDGNGLVYWPPYNLNFIGDLIPGQAYLIKMNQSVIFTYTPN